MANEIAKATPTGNDSPFERIKRTNTAGNEYWSSRDFAQILGYSDYRNFALCPLIIEETYACLSIPPNEGQVFVPNTVNVPEVRQCKLLQNFVARIKNVLITANAMQKT